MGVFYKGTHGEIKRTSGNTSLLNWKAQSLKCKRLDISICPREKEVLWEFPPEARGEACGKVFPEEGGQSIWPAKSKDGL